MPKIYAYTYSTVTCPDCSADLTEPRGIELAVTVGGISVDAIYTRLEKDGSLIDVDRLVANGYHGGTMCGRCCESLEEYEKE